MAKQRENSAFPGCIGRSLEPHDMLLEKPASK